MRRLPVDRDEKATIGGSVRLVTVASAMVDVSAARHRLCCGWYLHRDCCR